MSAAAISPTGTFTQKTERQLPASTSAPPSTGPIARLTPITPAQMPIACARSRASVKVLRMIDIATGLSIEPPTACTMRKTINSCTVGARLHSSEPSVNSTSPSLKTRARPKRSAIEPESISRLASTSV